jgi:hypothetical protein
MAYPGDSREFKILETSLKLIKHKKIFPKTTSNWDPSIETLFTVNHKISRKNIASFIYKCTLNNKIKDTLEDLN